MLDDKLNLWLIEVRRDFPAKKRTMDVTGKSLTGYRFDSILNNHYLFVLSFDKKKLFDFDVGQREPGFGERQSDSGLGHSGRGSRSALHLHRVLRETESREVD